MNDALTKYIEVTEELLKRFDQYQKDENNLDFVAWVRPRFHEIRDLFITEAIDIFTYHENELFLSVINLFTVAASAKRDISTRDFLMASYRRMYQEDLKHVNE